MLAMHMDDVPCAKGVPAWPPLVPLVPLIIPPQVPTRGGVGGEGAAPKRLATINTG